MKSVAQKWTHRCLLRAVNQWQAARLSAALKLANDKNTRQIQHERDMARMKEVELAGQLEV